VLEELEGDLPPMRKTLPPALIALVLFGCGTPTTDEKKSWEGWTPPAAGTIVVTDSMKVSADSLNDFQFSVLLTVSENNAQADRNGFRYDVQARYGHGEARGEVVMPRGGNNLQPLLRRDTGSTYIIGFIPGAAYGGDTSFHPYYLVKGSRQGIEVKALKSYSFN
jgi:hypothetical protein